MRTTTFVNSASSIAVVVAQSTLLGLALMKHIVARRAGWGRTPLISVLIRDGTATYVIICGMNFASDIAIHLIISNAVVIFMFIGAFCELRDERVIITFL
jgi:hypothetical protein